MLLSFFFDWWSNTEKYEEGKEKIPFYEIIKQTASLNTFILSPLPNPPNYTINTLTVVPWPNHGTCDQNINKWKMSFHS